MIWQNEPLTYFYVRVYPNFLEQTTEAERKIRGLIHVFVLDVGEMASFDFLPWRVLRKHFATEFRDNLIQGSDQQVWQSVENFNAGFRTEIWDISINIQRSIQVSPVTFEKETKNKLIFDKDPDASLSRLSPQQLQYIFSSGILLNADWNIITHLNEFQKRDIRFFFCNEEGAGQPYQGDLLTMPSSNLTLLMPSVRKPEQKAPPPELPTGNKNEENDKSHVKKQSPTVSEQKKSGFVRPERQDPDLQQGLEPAKDQLRLSEQANRRRMKRWSIIGFVVVVTAFVIGFLVRSRISHDGKPNVNQTTNISNKETSDTQSINNLHKEIQRLKGQITLDDLKNQNALKTQETAIIENIEGYKKKEIVLRDSLGKMKAQNESLARSLNTVKTDNDNLRTAKSGLEADLRDKTTENQELQRRLAQQTNAQPVTSSSAHVNSQPQGDASRAQDNNKLKNDIQAILNDNKKNNKEKVAKIDELLSKKPGQ